MKISNFKIGSRLALLTFCMLFMVIAVGLKGWHALRVVNHKNTESVQHLQALANSIDSARKAQLEFKIQVQEWKNILLRGNDPVAFEKYKGGFIQKSELTKLELLKTKVQFSKLGLDTALIDEALRTHEELQVRYLEALKKFDISNSHSVHIVDGLVRGIDQLPTKKIDDIVSYIQEASGQLSKEMATEATAHYQTTSLVLLAAGLSVAGLGVAIAFWLARSITHPINEAVKVAETVASGDLTANIVVNSKDETGQLLQALKNMNDSLLRIVGQIRQGTDTIATASAQIASGNQDLSSRTEEQASSLEETASSMEELTSAVHQNADNARQANQLAVTASDIAMEGGVIMSQVVQTMDAINSSSKKIVDIIGVIDGIAFQTNILALNAAVEAARAGEQGRGFAVVATEVRNLAQRSASAAREIKGLIDDSVEKVENGSKLVSQAGVTMNEVVASIRRVNAIMSEITAASIEQSEGITQVNQAITQMDTVTQQNAALVEEAAAAAESLQQQAKSLVEVVNVFRTDHALALSASPKLAPAGISS